MTGNKSITWKSDHAWNSNKSGKKLQNKIRWKSKIKDVKINEKKKL